MTVWSEARKAGLAARSGAQADRSASSVSRATLPRAEERWENGVCVYCAGRAGRRVGLLPLTGPVFFCKNHAKQYRSDKDWEARRKKELGLGL